MVAMREQHHQLFLDVLSITNFRVSQFCSLRFLNRRSHTLRRGELQFWGLCIHCLFRTCFSVIFVFSGLLNMIFLQNCAAKFTRKEKYFFDQPWCFPWVAWLSRPQSLLKSIRPPKIWRTCDRYIPMALKSNAKTKAKNQNRKVSQKFICISRLRNTQMNYLKKWTTKL